MTLQGGLRMAGDTVEIIHTFDERWEPPVGGQRMSVAFACDGPGEVDEQYERLVAGGHPAPWDAFWGQRYPVVHDPDGNPVDLFAAL